MKQEFKTFFKTCSKGLEICGHGTLTLAGLLKDMIAADREGNW